MSIDFYPPLPDWVPDGDNLSASAQASTILPNGVINGDFQVWQRGGSITSTGISPEYTADRWAMVRGAGTQITSRQLTGLTTFQYCGRAERQAADVTLNTLYLAQSIESLFALPFANQQVTISCWVRTSAGFPGALTVNVQYGGGVDEGPLAAFTAPQATFIAGTVVTPNTTWTYYQFSGFCVATCSEMKVYFQWVPTAVAGANYFDVTGVQLEVGSRGSPYQWLPFDASLQKCKRYYQKSFNYFTAPATAAGNSGIIQYYSKVAAALPDTVMVYPTVPFRIAPTLTFFNPGAANNKWRNLSAAADSGVAVGSGAGENNFAINNPQVAADAANALMGVHYTASAEL